MTHIVKLPSSLLLTLLLFGEHAAATPPASSCITSEAPHGLSECGSNYINSAIHPQFPGGAEKSSQLTYYIQFDSPYDLILEASLSYYLYVGASLATKWPHGSASTQPRAHARANISVENNGTTFFDARNVEAGFSGGKGTYLDEAIASSSVDLQFRTNQAYKITFFSFVSSSADNASSGYASSQLNFDHSIYPDTQLSLSTGILNALDSSGHIPVASMIPEPESWVLYSIGLIPLIFTARRRGISAVR